MIDLDPDEYDMDGVSDRVKVMGKNFEIVGKHEQRKARPHKQRAAVTRRRPVHLPQRVQRQLRGESRQPRGR